MAMKLLITLSLIVVVCGFTNGEVDFLATKMEEVPQFIREKCNNATGGHTVAENALDSLMQCVNDAAHEDWGLYDDCRTYEFKFTCIKDFINAIEPCMDAHERVQKDTLVGLAANLLDFWCQNIYKKNSFFETEGVSQCGQQSSAGLNNCMKSQITKDSLNEVKIEDLWKLLFKQDVCNLTKRVQECYDKTLEACENTAFPKLITSMFKFTVKGTPCNKSV